MNAITNMNQLISYKGRVIKVTFFRRKGFPMWSCSIKERYYHEPDTAFDLVEVLSDCSLDALIAKTEGWLAVAYRTIPPVPQIPADLAHQLAAPLLPTGDYRMMVVDHPIG